MSSENGLETFTDECFGEYLKVIHAYTGITIGASRKSMVQGRVRKRISQLNLAGYPEYLVYLKSNPSEKPNFIDLITTNETYFFRTPRVWSYIEDHLLPEWHTQNTKQTFRAWSAAASSGEEAHSLGVLCYDFKSTHKDFSFQILGTDISQEMVSLCNAAMYKGRSIESFQKLKPELFKKYMQVQKDGEFKAIAEIRAQIKFQIHNLFELLKSKEQFDLIMLRNVLIYFKQPDQEKVLQNIHALLKPKGILIIGESESLSHIHSDFASVQPLIYAPLAAKAQMGKVA